MDANCKCTIMEAKARRCSRWTQALPLVAEAASAEGRSRLPTLSSAGVREDHESRAIGGVKLSTWSE